MTRKFSRVTATAAAAAVSAGLFLFAAAPSSAFDAGALQSVIDASIPGSTHDNNFHVVELAAPAACDAGATRHVTQITGVTATVPAQQALADAWVGDNLYATASVGLPGPLTVQASNSWQGLADGFGQQLVPGVYHFVLRCQNNLGTTIFEEWSGGVVFSSPTSWTGFVGANPPVLATTTTAVTASPQPVTTDQNVTLTASVSESDPASPTGTVAFFNGGTSLGSAAVSGSGVATIALALAAGTYNFTGVYSGDATFATSTGAAPPGFVVSSATSPPDTAVPSGVLSGPRATTTLGSSALVTWSGADNVGVSSYDLRYRSAAWNKSLGGYVYPAGLQATSAKSSARAMALGSLYCFSVRARDAAGNVSAWSAERCTARPLDDRSLKAKGAWKKKKGASYFAGTIAMAKAKGANLNLKGAVAGRVALVATTGKGMGKVGIYYNGKLVKKVNLAAKKKTTTRVVFALPKLARSGTITIKVLSSGKTVQVDGLVSARR